MILNGILQSRVSLRVLHHLTFCLRCLCYEKFDFKLQTFTNWFPHVLAFILCLRFSCSSAHPSQRMPLLRSRRCLATENRCLQVFTETAAAVAAAADADAAITVQCFLCCFFGVFLYLLLVKCNQNDLSATSERCIVLAAETVGSKML